MESSEKNEKKMIVGIDVARVIMWMYGRKRTSYVTYNTTENIAGSLLCVPLILYL